MAKYKLPTMKDLLDAGVHFGHQIRRWHPSMEKYIFSERLGIHVIDLEQTEKLLEDACEFIYKIASEGGQIVFVGTKRQASEIIKLEAQRSGVFFVNERWLGGTITNFTVINKNIKKLVNLKNKKEKGELSMYTKKEQLLIDREIAKLDRIVGGIVGLRGTPSAVVVFDAKREKTAIREANTSDVPVVALIDTNTNPAGVDYLVPGNDDAIRSIALIAKAFADAAEAGYQEYAKTSKAKATAAVKEDSTSEDETPVTEEPVRVSGAEATHASEVTGKKLIKNIDVEVEEVVEDDESDESSEKPSKKSKKDSESKSKSKKASPSSKAKSSEKKGKK